MKNPAVAKVPPPVELRPPNGIVSESRRYRLLTPLFGGGVDPGMADPITPIRASSVKGQLRFWWRATRGGRYRDLAEMRQAEDRLWGAAADEKHGTGQSLAHLEVRDVTIGTARNDYSLHGAAHPYAAFPLIPSRQEQRRGALVRPVRCGVSFTLNVRYRSADAADVKAALWAWETFGGVGARTRRGFGAVAQVGPTGKTREIEAPVAFIEEGLAEHLDHGSGYAFSSVPHISAVTDWKVSKRSWSEAIEALRVFRQARPGFGRSYWPEPDEIRRCTGVHLQTNQRTHAPVHPVHKFPRAAFGLPIVFWFKDGPEENERDPSRRDPAQVSLEHRLSQRWASPLVLRPLNEGNKQVTVALILQGTTEPLSQLLLRDAPPWSIDASLTAAEAGQIVPLAGKRATTDVLLAFLETL